jgi:hypothetical protein
VIITLIHKKNRLKELVIIKPKKERVKKKYIRDIDFPPKKCSFMGL